jgi:hypothetical protein
MKTPQANAAGYERSAITDMTGFHTSNFLLIHGTGDDNVHWQNSATLLYALTRAGVSGYRVQVFPDSDHSMNSPGAGRLVYEQVRGAGVGKCMVVRSGNASCKSTLTSSHIIPLPPPPPDHRVCSGEVCEASPPSTPVGCHGAPLCCPCAALALERLSGVCVCVAVCVAVAMAVAD